MKKYWSEKNQTYGIFRAYRHHPITKQVMWARSYGLKAWFIPMDELDSED